MNKNDLEPFFYNNIQLQSYRTINYLKYGMFFICLNTTAILLLTSLMFTEINTFYNEITSQNITSTVSQLGEIINNACNLYPELCGNS